MATTKVGMYRKYHGKVPVGADGQPIPMSQWARRRPFSWAVRWFGLDGNRYSKSFKSRKEAERFAEAKQKEVREGQADKPPVMALKEYAEVYRKLRTDLSPRTLDNHVATLQFLKDRLGEGRQLQGIQPMDAKGFISWYRTRTRKGCPVSDATVNRVIRECRRIFREAVDCGLLRTSPFEKIRTTKTPQSKEWHYVTADEYRRLMDACPSLRWRGIIGLAYCCGLRSGEILNMTWSDIDFASEELHVLGKLERGGMHRWTPKDKDPRVIPVPTEALGILTELYAVARDRQTYVFVNSKGPAAGDRVKRQNTWRDFHAIARRAGLPTCSLHHLRKTWCTNLAGSLPMHVVQELAGHSDIRTTRQFYVKIPPEQMARARRAIDALVRPELVTE